MNLDELVKTGMITSWELVPCDEYGNLGRKSDNRNYEKLTIRFPNGKVLLLSTWCSGISQDTGFDADVFDD